MYIYVFIAKKFMTGKDWRKNAIVRMNEWNIFGELFIYLKMKWRE